MESCRALALCAVAAALLLGARGQGPAPPRRARDLGPPGGGGGGGASREKELIEALQEVLEKLKSKRVPLYEKKFGQVPMCDAGEQCAVRKGARIGKLCDCPRGTSCNSFLLKCL
ncbi:cocaine- and amphetamine-regulated transcript protein [Ciconia maguari]